MLRLDKRALYGCETTQGLFCQYNIAHSDAWSTGDSRKNLRSTAVLEHKRVWGSVFNLGHTRWERMHLISDYRTNALTAVAEIARARAARPEALVVGDIRARRVLRGRPVATVPTGP